MFKDATPDLTDFLDATIKLVRGADPAPVVDELLASAIRLAQADRGLVVTRDAKSEWIVRAAQNYQRATLPPIDQRFSKAIVEEVLKAGKGVAFELPFQDPRFFKSGSCRDLVTKGAVAVPLVDVEGVLTLFERKRPTFWTEADLPSLSRMAELLGYAIRLADADAPVRGKRRDAGRRRARLIGSSPVMQKLIAQIDRVAPTSHAVLILGESGTGKEEAARSIHEKSPRRRGPFVAKNMGALADTLIESELFGHAKGAFSGATTDRLGAFQQADGGTLFLDEIGELKLELQAKLLRAIQEGEVEPLGSDQPRKVDVRIVAATNADLEDRARNARTFRADLLYRLNTVTLRMPPLRERREDIPELVEHFLRHASAEVPGPPRRIGEDALKAIMASNWRGNVRELKNKIDRAVIMSEGEVIAPLDLDIPKTKPIKRLAVSEAETRRTSISNALKEAHGVVRKAAPLLGVSVPTLYRQLEELGIDASAYRS